MKPTCAVLLAAGRGKRLRPYTDRLPKPLLPVSGRTILDTVLQAVARAGIQRVCLVIHHLGELVRLYAGDGTAWGLQVVYCQQAELRGSGDALQAVQNNLPGWIDHSAPLLVSATDYLLPENALLDLVNAHEKEGYDITLSLREYPPEQLSARSSVVLGPGWQIKKIIEKPAPGAAPSLYTAALLYILPPAIWEMLPRLEPSPRGELELPDAVNMLIETGFSACGFLQPAPPEWVPEMEENLVNSVVDKKLPAKA